MFGNYVFEKSAAAYVNKLLIVDVDNLMEKENIAKIFQAHDFSVVWYQDDLDFRLHHSSDLEDDGKLVIVAKPAQYIPYDIRRKVTIFRLCMQELFPLLNAELILELDGVDKDLLVQAYSSNFSDLSRKDDTEIYIEKVVRSTKNVQRYLAYSANILEKQIQDATDYQDWYHISREKAKVDVLAAKYDITITTEKVNDEFLSFILSEYGKLSGKIDAKTPVLVSRAMEYMNDNSEKFVVVIMDGMSQFDWNILQESFKGIKFEQAEIFAMIPTTTSISRQCLLSNKYPSQLMNPWSQVKEKSEFIECAKSFGFAESQIGYERGYDADFGLFVKCGAVIINEIDDIVHGQKQGKPGMFYDIDILRKQHKLRTLVKRLLDKNFDVYITSDHGNTECIGLGKLMGTGVEVETKSRRMMVLKDYANKEALKVKYNLLEYPKYYLPKEYDYLICPEDKSFDVKGVEVMSHGGTTIDEVVIPFIKIKAVENNG